MYIILCNSLEKHGSTDIGLQLVKKKSSPFLKIGETRTIFIPFGKIPVRSERLKIYLSGLKITLAQNLTTDDEISSNPGLFIRL